MEKIFLDRIKVVLFLLVLFFTQQVNAQEIDLTQYIQLAKAYNIDIEEAKTRPYIGYSFEYVKNSNKPFLIVFADFDDVMTAASYVNNGYFVYNNLQHDYGFTVFNIKNSDNADLVEKLNVKSVPYVVVTNPKNNKIIPIKSELYENPKRMVYLLRSYLRKMR